MKRNVVIFVVLLLFVSVTGISRAEEEKKFKVTWGPGYETLTITYPGGEYQYTRDMLKESFPAPGEKPVFKFEKEWPLVLMHARWSEPATGWPAKYRPHALDIILMFACDAQLYAHVYPDVIRSSQFTFPPEYLEETKETVHKNLVEMMRGKEVGYEVVAKGGFGAGDFKIKTKIHIGLSQDGKTVFYHDSPEYISDYLKSRDFFFAAHDAGDRIEFEAIMACTSTPRGFFRDAALDRMEEDGEYFVDRLYDCFRSEPTEAEIEKYLDLVKKQRHDLSTLSKQHKIE
ncbi:MAG: hypothetical protein PHE61_02690 [Candidatus Omnitrophica bacterium]|nr:hypothetical protein [Candidatus Omnitrophota bacterium]